MPDDLQQPHHRPPAQPAYVLRGHAAPVHAVRFLAGNARLLTGDADGWVVLWSLATKRPVAVWRAHSNAILGLCHWAPGRIVTHGRDSHLRVWQLLPQDHHAYSTTLPVDGAGEHRKEPWLLHSLLVNTLNFCSFSMCAGGAAAAEPPLLPNGISLASEEEALVAVPGVKDDTTDVFQLPSQHRVFAVPALKTKTGMVMALSIHSDSCHRIRLISAYESGATAVHVQTNESNFSRLELLYISAPHTQPILSLSPSPLHPAFYTSGADDLIALHHFGRFGQDQRSKEDAATEPGTSDAPAMREAGASDPASPPPAHGARYQNCEPANLARALGEPRDYQWQSEHQTPEGQCGRIGDPTSPVPPFKSVHTRHAGQQSIAVRSDDRVLATAGWDGRVRVYHARTLKELAVLKYHGEGCYAVAFADVGRADANTWAGPSADADPGVEAGGAADAGSSCGAGVGRACGAEKGWERVEGSEHADAAADAGAAAASALQAGAMRAVPRAAAKTGETVRQRRERRAAQVHWLAAGSKDGKVSLWDVY